jgi:glycogen operon protein
VTVSVSRLERGRPGPFGARVDGNGVNFAVFSEHAEAIELCLYDARGERETARLALHRSGDVWHGRLPGAGAGVVYGLRAHGLWRPDEGHRFNAHKLLLDPYAHEIVGRYEWRAEHFAGDAEGRIDTRDNGAHALKARVVADTFDWGEDRAPRTPLADTLLYELHVKGFTRLHSSVPEALRGTYAGLASDAAIAHLRRLGVSAVSLLPVQQHLDEQRLVTQGLSNYWGYNTIGYFAPEPRYASDGTAAAARADFRAMVRRLHAAGLEVIVDVVYNHTAETDELGPTISWRGLDNRSWYRLQPGRPALYENMSGCGNTLDLRHPRVLQMVLDSLRHWVDEYHVDGFRFDLATVLGRGDHRYDARAAFFQAVAQDPLLAPVKLIAEPWDVGAGGYQLGRFPSDWLEWNDKFRDAARDFWLTGRASAGEFAQRLSASSDLFRHGRRVRRSTTSLRTTASRCATPSATSTDTTRPTASTTATATPTTGAGTAASKATPTTPPCSRCARACSAHCSRRCCCRRARRCSPPATNSATRSAATTTPTVRTTPRPGSTGRAPTRPSSPSPRH